MRARRGSPACCAGWLLILTVALARPAGVRAAPPLPRLGSAPNFALTTQQNDRLWLTQLRDRLVVLTFTCTTCEVCPDLLPALANRARSIGDAAGRRVFFVVVTVDPQRDSAEVLHRFARARGLVPPAWLFLTGTPPEVNVVTRRYGVPVRRDGGRISHDCLVALIDGTGVIRARYGAAELARLEGDLATLLGELGGR